METVDRTIALLIDSDNISHNYFKILIDELNKFGNITYKRIYGDFTVQNANGWRSLLLEFAIKPMQQYACTAGKNATDMAMVIDAMDILYTGKVDCICLATSDSDFTKLAMRFRNENYMVIGAGEQKTPKSFIAACDKFLLMDILLAEIKASQTDRQSNDEKKAAIAKSTGDKKQIENNVNKTNETRTVVLSLSELIALMKEIIKKNDEKGDGFANYGQVYKELCLQEKTFNPRNYGIDKKPITFFRELPGNPFIIEIGKDLQRIKASE
jgi:uncharacterized protein (TIGR00288 family)